MSSLLIRIVFLKKMLEKTKNSKISLISTCEMLNKQLHETNIDVAYSGSTSVTLLLDNDYLYCANVGDSRAMLGRLNSQSNAYASFITLTRTMGGNTIVN